jgi:multiple sugar transport system ATP-binding protein
MNMLPVSVDGSVKIAGAEIRIGQALSGGPTTIGFRPEAVTIGGDGPIPARIRVVEDLGSEAFVHLVVDHEGEEQRIVAKVDPPFAGEPGENVRLSLRGDLHLFDEREVRRATVTL